MFFWNKRLAFAFVGMDTTEPKAFPSHTAKILLPQSFSGATNEAPLTHDGGAEEHEVKREIQGRSERGRAVARDDERSAPPRAWANKSVRPGT
jgi:hypothetical protein